jgi:hypothetical protein
VLVFKRCCVKKWCFSIPSLCCCTQRKHPASLNEKSGIFFFLLNALEIPSVLAGNEGDVSSNSAFASEAKIDFVNWAKKRKLKAECVCMSARRFSPRNSAPTGNCSVGVRSENEKSPPILPSS